MTRSRTRAKTRSLIPNEKKHKEQPQCDETLMCKSCKRRFANKRGLSVHTSRFCEVYKTSLLDGGDEKYTTVNNKSSVPGSKPTQLRCRSDFIHKFKIKIDETSIPRRARLKFPHIADNKKWKHIDEVVSKSVKPIINKLKSNDINTTTLSFEQTVYDTLAEHLEVTKPIRKQFQKQKPRPPPHAFAENKITCP